ncbi:LysM peptidoglycan-binding domain-containing protein [Streptomyces sp. H27-D2]|uniref:LysM peptidoglycan-binding domain-containing protein n=1 Tax=Streptomyces sp. H27-D2 TaxID=3046304 RepID=UPI002DBBE383|nr:peptidoglycan-binding protein [Streptomyces sp. H27-D2]MEC4017584.1 peptidoglycan-binding protein [Streptomyces sp. H27-D2]
MKTQDAYYIVEEGDTLSAIARRYGTTVKQLQAWNHIPNPDKIKIGQRLIVSKDERDVSEYVPFPGAEWFKRAPNSPIISMMAYRLVDEGCSAYKVDPEPQWTREHRDSYALWQRELGYTGADADGWPGAESWAKLNVPFPGE